MPNYTLGGSMHTLTHWQSTPHETWGAWHYTSVYPFLLETASPGAIRRASGETLKSPSASTYYFIVGIGEWNYTFPTTTLNMEPYRWRKSSLNRYQLMFFWGNPGDPTTTQGVLTPAVSRDKFLTPWAMNTVEDSDIIDNTLPFYWLCGWYYEYHTPIRLPYTPTGAGTITQDTFEIYCRPDFTDSEVTEPLMSFTSVSTGEIVDTRLIELVGVYDEDEQDQSEG